MRAPRRRLAIGLLLALLLAGSASLVGQGPFPAQIQAAFQQLGLWPYGIYTNGQVPTWNSTTSQFAPGSGGGGGGAPTDATYITQTPNASLSAEQPLSALSSGIMRSATTTGVVTVLTTSAGIAANISDETGSGALVFGTAPTITLTNGTGLPIAGITGLGTGVGTALAVNVGSAGAPVLFNGALGTPSSGTATNLTGLPAAGVVAGTLTGLFTHDRKVTITQGTANESVIASTGFSLTGSSAVSMLDYAGTWNTSGAPSALKVSITDSAPVATSVLFNFISTNAQAVFPAYTGRLTVQGQAPGFEIASGALPITPGAATVEGRWFFTGTCSLFYLRRDISFSSCVPSISSGGGTGASIAGKEYAFDLNVGTGGSASSIVLGMTTVTTNWNCQVSNLTARAAHRTDETYQTASTTSSVTLENQSWLTGAATAWTASDHVRALCTSY